MGASVSAADTAVSLIDHAQAPIYAVTRGKYNVYFGEHAFKHPQISERPPISHISVDDRTVYFEDGTSASEVDHIIFGTGFTWTLPFLPDIPTRNNRVPDLYLHVFHQRDPSLIFIGAVRPPLLHQFNPVNTNRQPGRHRPNLQNLRMASRSRRPRPRRKSPSPTSRHSTTLGSRPHRGQRRRGRVHAGASGFQGIF